MNKDFIVCDTTKNLSFAVWQLVYEVHMLIYKQHSPFEIGGITAFFKFRVSQYHYHSSCTLCTDFDKSVHVAKLHQTA